MPSKSRNKWGRLGWLCARQEGEEDEKAEGGGGGRLSAQLSLSPVRAGEVMRT